MDDRVKPESPSHWRSLEEYEHSEKLTQWLEREFPRFASEWPGGLSRRRFLQLMGASLALAGLTGGCVKQPPEAIVPYINQPENMTPGELLQYATAMEMNGVASGILATSTDGRPIKIEGNPRHPTNAGGTDVFMQASILSLYDPDRAQSVKYYGAVSSWEDFQAAMLDEMARARARGGAGVRILTGAVTSPTLTDQIQSFLKVFPQARWHVYEPVHRDNSRTGARLAFNQPVRPLYRFDQADVILSLDADFLLLDPNRLFYARGFAERRRVRKTKENMNRLYVAESAYTITGAMADHRLPARPGEVEPLAIAVAQALGIGGLPAPATLRPDHAQWAQRVARDLRAHGGSSIVIAGETQPPAVHALAHLINATLGNAGRTVNYLPEMEANPFGSVESIEGLARDMAAGQVDLLLILDGNPAYSAPANLDFIKALKKVRLGIHLGEYEDETAAYCHWHLPKSHYLESWGDTRACEGAVAIQQPLIQPLFDSRSTLEVLAILTAQPVQSGYDLVRRYWSGRLGGGGAFEAAWTNALNNGIIDGTALPAQAVRPRPDLAAQLAADMAKRAGQSANASKAGALDIVFLPDPSVWDGRFANNAWLQEMPKPILRLTWDNAAVVGVATAEQMKLANNDVVKLTLNGHTVQAPVLIVPGVAEGCVITHLGYGRERAGTVGNKTGFNAYVLRTGGQQWFASGLALAKTGRQYQLAMTQNQQLMEGRPLIREGTIAEFRRNPNFVHEGDPREEVHARQAPTLYPTYPSPINAWAMVIDNNVCIGCNACVAACQSENNIPTVGKTGVLRERAMHWIRIDAYFKGKPNAPEVLFEPVPCMHCEKAPCEVVCPVGATVHSEDGLNEMIYNRCVGTRYCSNNCPYKVRRFNFLNYTIITNPISKMVMNPDVTVRSRGVMEKCTYCVQRIKRVQIEAAKDNRPIRDGEVKTACQMACPTQAIYFGDLNNRESEVLRLRGEPHEFSLLAELNTRPRTTYLATFKNPNPEMEAGKTS